MDYFKLNKIDEFIIDQKIHYYLTKEDNGNLGYLGEYVALGGFTASDTNHLIDNFKIQPIKTHRLKYKQDAMHFFAHNLVKVLPRNWLQSVTIVPVPPSKLLSDYDDDDRLNHLLDETSRILDVKLDVRDYFIQKLATQADHKNSHKRLAPKQRALLYTFNEKLKAPLPHTIIIFDDMITTGSHYKALKFLLSQVYPNVKIHGIFLSRRIEKQQPIQDVNS